ncbi:MRP family ATP-binding protein [bacterium]|nr:MRP family ATP-binding protein [bacterium]
MSEGKQGWREEVVTRLRGVKYPGFSRDIVSFGLVQDMEMEGTDLKLKLKLTTPDPAIPEKIGKEIRDTLKGYAPVKSVTIETEVAPPQATATTGPQGIEGVKKIVAVASGKGGVGKSTVAANLAVSLAKNGMKVGLCDCDLYGPSQALMLGCHDGIRVEEGTERIVPAECHGVKLMSMGMLLGDDSPAALRGPMVTRFTQQFLRQVAWGELDVLILDLPPGTGDIQLTIVQTVALDGAVIVTTPQEVALVDARKAIAMFRKVNVTILGLVENMSYFLVPGTSQKHEIFGSGGGKREAERQKVALLGEIPLDPEARSGGDEGNPVVLANPRSPSAMVLRQLAEQLEKILISNIRP